MISQLVVTQSERIWTWIQECVPAPYKAVFEREKAWLLDVLGLSDFLVQVLQQNPAGVAEIIDSGVIHHPYEARVELDLDLTTITEDDLYRQLRLFRQKQMWIIAVRDLLGQSTLQESFLRLTQLADTCITQTLHWLYQQNVKKYGLPEQGDARICPLCVVALGKLGASELNFSSDIDLMFCFPHSGQTQHEQNSISHQEFFIRLGQQLIQALNQTTENGFVFRVDMRLRPFGNDGPLAVSFEFIENYYQQHGRYWERFALIKQRILGATPAIREQLKDILIPFVYRRYLDYGIIQALQELKAQILAEVRRRKLENNIKLGSGGIREIEFVVQALQLIQGGQRSCLQTSSLMKALEILMEEKIIEYDDGVQLREDYLWLRRLENQLQIAHDQQTHALPSDNLGKERLVIAMRCADWNNLYTEYQAICERVRQLFLQVIGPPVELRQELPDWWLLAYEQLLDEEDINDFFLICRPYFEPKKELIAELQKISSELYAVTLQPRGTQARAKLLPLLFYESCYKQLVNAETLRRLALIVRAIMGRTPYLDLLLHNREARAQLIKLAASHLILAEQLSEYPILLDELLDPLKLYIPIPTGGYRKALHKFMLRVDQDDLEQQMESLRQFKQIQHLRVSAAETVLKISVMRVSNYLSWVAEALIDFVVMMALKELENQYGLPADLPPGETGLVILGYGKLGGIELGYLSDLDLVFLYDDAIQKMTTGKQPLEVEQFYYRFVQRILHLLNTRMVTGVLYQTDVRLRPDGEAGLLCPSVKSWAQYLAKKAWIWELQALVRSRAVYGSNALCARVKSIRHHVLSQRRQADMVVEEIHKMRAKIYQQQPRLEADHFDLKHSPGGLIDIEFLAQKIMLLFATFEGQELTQWTDTVRIFDAAAMTGILPLAVTQELKKAYLLLRQTFHACSLEHKSGVILREQLCVDVQKIAQYCSELDLS